MKKKTKKFDCVDMKRRVQARIYERIRKMTPKQQRAYFNAEPSKGSFAAWFKKVKQADAARRDSSVA